MRTIGILAVILLAAGPAIAGPPPHQTVVWSTLGQVKESATASGMKVEFARDVDALDRAYVSIQGYRIPLATRTHFLLASKPSDCETCIEGGPASYVEVFARAAVEPTFGRPLTVAGKLELVRNEPSGAYYRLVDAEVVSVD